MSISLNGYKNQVVTFEANENLTPGLVVMDNSLIVKNAVADDDFIGYAISKNGYITNVQTEGYIELPYTGSTMNFGYRTLVASGAGTVANKESATAGKKRLVVKIDAQNKIVGFIL